MGLTTQSPGGLKAAYFSSPDLLPDHLVLTRVENQIESYSIGELVGTKSHFGAVWNGKLVADHNEEYLIKVECNIGGFSSHAIDGKYSPWQSCYPQMTTSVVLEANKAADLSLRYKSLEDFERPSAFIILKWASASTSTQKIPPSNLYHHVIVGNNTLHPVIAPSNAHPSQSTAIGDSLRAAISGIQQGFLVESRDEYAAGLVGNLLAQGGTAVAVDGFHHQDEGNLHIQPTIDNDNGTYTVQYTPDATGVYFMSVTIDGSDIKESPFLLRVEPGETDPLQTILLGAETIVGATGREMQLQLQAMDANSNKGHKGGDDILAVMVASPGEGFTEMLDCKVDYATEGLYSITCPVVSQSRSYLLDFSIATSSGLRSINSSPFKVTIYPSHAIPETSEVISGSISGQNVNFISDTGLFQSFVVRVCWVGYFY